MSHIKTFTSTPTCFDHHMMIETCRSAFKCFNVCHFKLMFQYIQVHLLDHYT
jgi:hypothetical protein